MKLLQKLLFAVLIIVPATTSTSCDVCDAIVLADLVAKAIFVPQTINFATLTNVALEITNKKSDDCSDRTRDAGSTFFLFSLFKKNSDNEFVEVEGDEEFQNSLAAGADLGLPFDVNIDGPGTYRIIGVTDSPDQVDERDEQNNDDEREVDTRGQQDDTSRRAEIIARAYNTNNYVEIEFEVVSVDGTTGTVIIR